MPDSPADQWRSTLRAALVSAMKERDASAVSVLRNAIAAIDNAEAASEEDRPAAEAGRIAGGVSGLGAGEVARRTLSTEEVLGALRCEAAARRAAADEHAGLVRIESAARLRAEAAVIDRLIAGH